MWLFEGQEFQESDIADNIGYVYMITNLADGRRYIGKKLFYFSKTRQVKGRKKRTKVLSDWPTYWSSSPELQADVARLGAANFRRDILYLCKTKGTLSYIEAREQFSFRVLEQPEAWYNGIIQCRIHRSHVKL
jgi:hypothetical protein